MWVINNCRLFGPFKITIKHNVYFLLLYLREVNVDIDLKINLKNLNHWTINIRNNFWRGIIYVSRWYDIALLVFSQPSLGIELQVQSQGTPVPAAAVSAARAATPPDYEHAQTGYSVTIGSIMGASLQVSGFWYFMNNFILYTGPHLDEGDLGKSPSWGSATCATSCWLSLCWAEVIATWANNLVKQKKKVWA